MAQSREKGKENASSMPRRVWANKAALDGDTAEYFTSEEDIVSVLADTLAVFRLETASPRTWSVLVPGRASAQALVPAVTDDVDAGYDVGSLWVTTTDNVYLCTDSTAGAANWELLNGAGGGAGSLQGAYDGGASITIGTSNPVALSKAATAGDMLTLTHNGAGDAISATVSDTSGQLLVCTESAVASVSHMVQLTRGSGGSTGDLIRLDMSFGTPTGAALRVVGHGGASFEPSVVLPVGHGLEAGGAAFSCPSVSGRWQIGTVGAADIANNGTQVIYRKAIIFNTETLDIGLVGGNRPGNVYVANNVESAVYRTTTTGATILSGTADPSAASGVAATVGSMYLRDNGGTTGELWLKTGTADTSWTLK